MRIILEVGTQIYQPKGLPWKSREGTENNRWSEVCANKKRKTWRADNKNKGCVRISGPSTEERPVKRDRMFAGCVFLLFCFIICLLGPRRAYIYIYIYIILYTRTDKHATPRCESSVLLIGTKCSGGTPRTLERFHQLVIHLPSTNVLRGSRSWQPVAQNEKTDGASAPISRSSNHARDACGFQGTPCSNPRTATGAYEQA